MHEENAVYNARIGSAIVVDVQRASPVFSELVYNPQCFLIYDDPFLPPTQWNDVRPSSCVSARHDSNLVTPHLSLLSRSPSGSLGIVPVSVQWSSSLTCCTAPGTRLRRWTKTPTKSSSSLMPRYSVSGASLTRECFFFDE